MPELPEVETFKNFFNRTFINRKVISLSLPETSMLEDTRRADIIKSLAGYRFTNTFRHGKYFFAQNEKGYELIIHYGMTGRLEFNAGNDLVKYSRLALEFSHGFLHFVCIRKLGRISITCNKDAYIKQKGLGPDALSLSKKVFLQMVDGKKGMVKPALMDQSFIAGLGNIYVDELCFKCGIKPCKKLGHMRKNELSLLYECMQDVLHASIKASAEISRMPAGWLIKRRKEGALCPRCGFKISRVKLQGRGTYYCGGCQSMD